MVGMNSRQVNFIHFFFNLPDLSFYWSALLLNVYEDEGTVDSLSIIKNGSSEVDVSLEVVVVTKHDFFEAERGKITYTLCVAIKPHFL